MESWPSWVPRLAVIDVAACVFLVLGFVMGMLRGLGPVFGTLLWLLVSLWISGQLASTVLGWLPNTADPGDPVALLTTFGLLCVVLLGLPALARLLGGAGGKKKQDPVAHYRVFGVLVGLICATLTFTLAAPFAPRVAFLARGYADAVAPEVAGQVAGTIAFLYPPAHRDELARLAKAEVAQTEAPTEPTPAPAKEPASKAAGK